MATDWALVERASPFVGALPGKTSVSIVLEGHGRFEENARRDWLSIGSIVASNQAQLGTEAYAGERTSVLVIEWHPEPYGAPAKGRFDHQRLSVRDLERARLASAGLDGPDPTSAVLELVDVLRANGLPLERFERGDLAPTTADEQRLARAIDAGLSRLEAFPSIEDVADELGWTTRHVNRRYGELAATLGMTASTWRGLLHHMRLVTAFRLLSVPTATTELVARRTGFRSPSALCHAFAKAGLPSPGVLARAAQRDVLDAWTAFSDSPTQSAAE